MSIQFVKRPDNEGGVRKFRVAAFSEENPNIKSSNEIAFITELQETSENEEGHPLKYFAKMAQDFDLAIIETERHELQQKDLVSYLVVKTKDEEGNEIPPERVHLDVEKNKIAMITFQHA